MPPLDAQEQSLLESVELSEWRSTPDLPQEIERYRQYAQAQGERLESVNLALPTSDLQMLYAFAQASGVSVSVLIASVLHQFVLSRQE